MVKTLQTIIIKIIVPEDNQKYHQREFPFDLGDFSTGSDIY